MSRARGKVLIAGFLIVAPEAFSVVCHARPQEDQAEGSQLEKTNTESSSNADSGDKLYVAPAKLADRDNPAGLNLFGRFFRDQEAIWSSPAEIGLADAGWLMPFGLALAGTLATDTEFSKHLSNSTSRLNHSNTFSNYGLGATGGLAGGLYLWGQMSHDDHKRETGLLAAEAAANSLAVVYSLNYSL